MSIQKTLQRAESELHAGRIWRAKEILRGAIAGGPPDAVLLERYGQLLDTLGERLEAGRYLFVSGVREAHYAEAIKLFLDRHARATPRQFARLIPNCVRRTPFAELPVSLQAELRARGVTPELLLPRVSSRQGVSMSWTDRLAVAGAVLVMLVFIAALVLGVGVIGRWVVGLFR